LHRTPECAAVAPHTLAALITRPGFSSMAFKATLNKTSFGLISSCSTRNFRIGGVAILGCRRAEVADAVVADAAVAPSGHAAAAAPSALTQHGADDKQAAPCGA